MVDDIVYTADRPTCEDNAVPLAEEDIFTTAAAVIVTFNPEPTALFSLVSAMKLQVGHCVVVDNASANRSSFWSVLDCETVALDTNGGIAKAQNVGILQALKLNPRLEAVFFLDQDSNVTPDLVKKLHSAYQSANSEERPVAAVGPLLQDARYDFYYPFVRVDEFGRRAKFSVASAEKAVPVSVLYASGSLISVRALRQVGLMNEAFFIDYVDTEWCLRAQSMGYALLAAPQARLLHRTGDRFIRVLGMNIPVHSAHRRFYRLRNGLLLRHMPWVPKSFVMREVLVGWCHQIILIAAGPERLGQCLTWVKAVRAGGAGKRSDVMVHERIDSDRLANDGVCSSE